MMSTCCERGKAIKQLKLALALGAGAIIAGCASGGNHADNTALTGSAGGAAVGAGIGSASGNAGRGALIGGSVGLTGGAVAGRNLEEQERGTTGGAGRRDSEASLDGR